MIFGFILELTSEEKPSLFDQIIAAAINHDEKILTELLEQGNLYYQDGYKPIKFLASHGNFHAIDFLIDKFRLDVNEVVFEYALSGYVEQVKELLIGKKVSKAKAILGYAISGNIEEVKKLLTHSSDKEDALLGFAMGGHEVWVNEMLSDGARIDVALRGYIKGGHTNRVKQLIVLGASKIQAVEEYYRNSFFPVSFLQLLAEFEDSEFRKLLIQKSNYGPYSIISAKENVTQRTHYKILGLADLAPFSAVESAYQRLLINAA